jgi:predicted Fe-Mo cluster-binding NifX family protein
MFIAVAADDQSLESLVSEEFILCKYLLIVDMDKMKFIAVEMKVTPLEKSWHEK